MEQKQIRTYYITNGDAPTGWGDMDSANLEEFLITTTAEVDALDDDWDITATGVLSEGMIFKGKIDCDIVELNGHKVTVFGRELTESELADTLYVEYQIGIDGATYLVILGSSSRAGVTKIIESSYIPVDSVATTDEHTLADYTFGADTLNVGDVIEIEGRFSVKKSDENSGRTIRVGSHPGTLISYELEPSIDIYLKFKFFLAIFQEERTVKAATSMYGVETYIPEVSNDSGYSVLTFSSLNVPILFMINVISENGTAGDFTLQYYKITKQS